jgi:Holliday junction resolvase-like predicted endonuclease
MLCKHIIVRAQQENKKTRAQATITNTKQLTMMMTIKHFMQWQGTCSTNEFLLRDCLKIGFASLTDF